MQNDILQLADGPVQALPLAPLRAVAQWIVVQLVPLANGKTDKLPIDYRTGAVTLKGSDGAHNPEIWLPHTAAADLVARWGPGYTVGFVLTAADPFWCLDIDSALQPDGTWSQLAQDLCRALPHTVVEVSQSGRGLHVWGQGVVPPHIRKRVDLGIELYDERRFIALGTGAVGDMSQPCPTIAAIAAAYFPPRAVSAVDVPDDGPCAEWRGPTDDDDLIRRAMRSHSAAGVFGATRASFADLWTADATALARAYPPDAGSSEPYDRSSADAALAQHLAFWTGRYVARIERLMRRSALVREKWDARDDYLVDRTIRGACARQVDVLVDREPEARSFRDVQRELDMLPSEDVRARWVGLAIDLPPPDTETFIDWVSSRVGVGVRPLQQELAAARKERKAQKRDHQIRAEAGPRQLIEHRPEAITALADQIEAEIVRTAAPGAYVTFGGVLSHVVARRLPDTHLLDDGNAAAPAVPLIETMHITEIRRQVERVAVLYDVKANGEKRIRGVPDDLLQVLRYKTARPAPALTGLLTHPIVLPSGEILAIDGLHAASGLYVWGATMPEARPYGREEASAALAWLATNVLEGFEFATPLDAAIALAGLFTGVQRRVLDSAPGLAILASMQASGKTTLARRLHVLLTGHDMPVSNFTFNDPTEAGKQLLSTLLRGPAMLVIDNVPDGFTVSSGPLAAAMTASSYTNRFLGESRDVTAPTNVAFVLTGNNLSLGADEVTRWMIVRLAPRSGLPEERRFKHPDVLGHALSIRRPALLHVVGIVAGYRRSGQQISSASRFEAWDRMVRQPLLWAGAADVSQVFRLNRESSEATSGLKTLLSALRRRFGDQEFTAGQVTALSVGTPSEVFEAQREALEGLRVKDTGNSRQVGMALKANIGKITEVGGVSVALASRQDPASNAQRYRVVSA
jgi:hypothetical protein